MESTLKSNTWKKVLLLSGTSGGIVYWRIVGTKADKKLETSQPYPFVITEPLAVGNPTISHTRMGTLPPPSLSWENNCNIKFKVCFGNDENFDRPGIKKKAFSFNIKNPGENGGIFTKELTSGQ